MSVIHLLSSSLGAGNDIPNQKLALELAVSTNIGAVSEIVDNLQFNKDKNFQGDCIKVLYEIGYKKPELIANHISVFVQLLQNKNNRLVWGSMIAISTFTHLVPSNVYSFLPEILAALDKGSVITIDAGVEILAKLASFPDYHDECFPLLLEQIKFCPPKQLGQYSEKALRAINQKNKVDFIKLINSRIQELDKDSQRKRISSLLKKLEK